MLTINTGIVVNPSCCDSPDPADQCPRCRAMGKKIKHTLNAAREESENLDMMTPPVFNDPEPAQQRPTMAHNVGHSYTDGDECVVREGVLVLNGYEDDDDAMMIPPVIDWKAVAYDGSKKKRADKKKAKKPRTVHEVLNDDGSDDSGSDDDAVQNSGGFMGPRGLIVTNNSGENDDMNPPSYDYSEFGDD